MFDKNNYRLMIAGVALIFIGYALMVGGKTEDPNVFNPDEIFSFRRITLAPYVVISGYVVVLLGILKKPKQIDSENE